jgi:hypothetical protein
VTKPEPPPKPISWEILYAGKRAKPLDDVEAVDEREAIVKAAEQFRATSPPPLPHKFSI